MSGLDEKLSDPGVVEKSGSAYPISTTKVTHRPWWKLGGKDISFAPVDPDSLTSSNAASTEDIEQPGLDNIHGSVFDDSGAAQFYQPIEKYEGAHRFDPNATWTPEEENALVRTVSLLNS
jgi:MFS transporter, ACS family, DAL5 transporter family protein